MTSGNNGASTPEDDDPFGYLYADGQANGAQPPSGGGGYGYPGSVNRVRAVGQRQYGQQQAASPYGQIPQQQGAYGQPNAHYAAPETHPGGAQTAQQQPAYSGGSGSGGRGGGPNTKGLLIGAIAVVAAVVIGISVAMLGGDDDPGDKGSEAGSTPTQSQQSSAPSPSNSNSQAAQDDLPTIDAKALALAGGATTASDVKGAQADGGVYVTGFNQVGSSVTWSVNGIPKSGKYTVYVGFSVPGKDGNATLTVNGTPSTSPVNLKNYAKGPEGDYEKGWTKTYNWIQLNKGTNTIKVSCEQGNQCDALIDQMWLVNGWVDS
ncbi:carbohydrate-binding protein [Streptomyces viridochromogenes]|uniref:Carbohydrate-binding protein n=1 Tax=Streptomyces viridochromogenes TaxID=1938 RepID=A0A0J8BTU5_STRVR|nr:CBM35 domain-containing protein [Streptomyces viridochromogenes]KMS68995.1 carbohydrate-binding protein [Streptomyces viridochromogenes]KOG16104.1 carbohydrate-binding protein [Streptomyces viridochromogenes]KOG16389.1 carbohydrate-binding protein [Streptomyces viridochromogenes]